MRIIWKIVKRLLQALAALAILLIVWFAFSSFYDEDLEPGLTEFFKPDAPIPDAQNGYIALGGLDAPSATQVFEYGRTISKRHENKPEGYSYLVNMPPSGSLNCWIGEAPSEKGVACLSAEQLTKLLADNRQLLTNYTTLYRYSQFQNQTFGGVLFGSDLIKLHELFMAQLVLAAKQGRGDIAIRWWIADAQFIQKLLQGETGTQSKAIFLVLNSINISAYRAITAQLTPEQLTVYQTQLDVIFDAPAYGPKGFDVAATMRSEYVFFTVADKITEEAAKERNIEPRHMLFFYKPNATRNRFYEFAKDMVALSEQPTESNVKAAKEKYTSKRIGSGNLNTITGLLYNPTGNLILGGIYVSMDLFHIPQSKYAHRQMLKLYTDAKIKRIPPEEMKAFVAASPIKNPMNGQAFGWDDASRKLFMTWGTEAAQRFEIPYNAPAAVVLSN